MMLAGLRMFRPPTNVVSKNCVETALPAVTIVIGELGVAVSPVRSRVKVEVPPRVKAPVRLSASAVMLPAEPVTLIVRLPPVARLLGVPLPFSVPTVLVGSPGLTVPELAVTVPVVPMPPRIAPELTVTRLLGCKPSTKSVPPLSVVAPL